MFRDKWKLKINCLFLNVIYFVRITFKDATTIIFQATLLTGVAGTFPKAEAQLHGTYIYIYKYNENSTLMFNVVILVIFLYAVFVSISPRSNLW